MVLAIKKTFGFKERNETKREFFSKFLKETDKRRLVFLDEAGIHNNESYEYGWAIKGQRLNDLKSGNRHKRLNIIGALKDNRLFAPFTFSGSCNADVFNLYLEKILKPELKDDDILILDNASFHRASKIYEIAKSVGCSVMYLPPYSPDFNDIEKHWFSVKHALKKFIRDGENDLDKIMQIIFDTNSCKQLSF